MTVLLYLMPAALFLGLLGLASFLWALKSGQFEDLDGAAHRILIDEDPACAQEGLPQSSGGAPSIRSMRSSQDGAA
jgi:cbb3-type cytochrome oxidase maturation protein